MKLLIPFLFILCLLLGCSAPAQQTDIAATTLPVYTFTKQLCQDTPLTVTQLVTQEISCLHDYSLNAAQVMAIEGAQLVVISGAGLEEAFMDSLLREKATVDASIGIQLIESCHEEGHEGHHHEADPHIWLSPVHAMTMAKNICLGLQQQYPEYRQVFSRNLETLLQQLQQLLDYGSAQLGSLSCRKLVPFHDGFSYFTQCFDLQILRAVEEESGSEASARELIELIDLVQTNQLPAIFVEENGSSSAASIIATETHIEIHTLSMAMSGQDYFALMYANIDTVRRALG